MSCRSSWVTAPLWQAARSTLHGPAVCRGTVQEEGLCASRKFLGQKVDAAVPLEAASKQPSAPGAVVCASEGPSHLVPYCGCLLRHLPTRPPSSNWQCSGHRRTTDATLENGAAEEWTVTPLRARTSGVGRWAASVIAVIEPETLRCASTATAPDCTRIGTRT